VGKKTNDTYHRFGELLVRKSVSNVRAVDEALAIQKAERDAGKTPRKIGRILAERKLLDRVTIREILQEQKLLRGISHTFKIDLRDEGGIALLTLKGRLDSKTSEALTRVLEKLMNRGFARVAVDATQLAYVDSRGISSFISYVDESRARGGDVKFFGLSAEATLLIHRLGLDKFLQVFPEKQPTVAAFDLPIDEYMSKGALGEYVSTPQARLFHLSYCASAQKIPEPDRTYFESKWHARDAGRKACQKCKP
jgi:anti-anti-sigma factor